MCDQDDLLCSFQQGKACFRSLLCRFAAVRRLSMKRLGPPCLQVGETDRQGRGFLQGGAADTRNKMRPDMMIVEMTTAEQQQYLRHDDNSGSKMTPLTPMMPNGNPRSVEIVEGGYCSDTRYEEKLQEKGAQHKALEEALRDYGYSVTTLPIIIGQSGSQYHTTSDALAKIGVEHGPANKVMSKLHEHSVLTFHNILTSRRVLEREKTDKRRQNRPDPP